MRVLVRNTLRDLNVSAVEIFFGNIGSDFERRITGYLVEIVQPKERTKKC